MLEEGGQVNTPLYDMMIYCWSSQMFLQETDMSIFYTAYILNLLYINLLQ